MIKLDKSFDHLITHEYFASLDNPTLAFTHGCRMTIYIIFFRLELTLYNENKSFSVKTGLDQKFLAKFY